MTIHTPNQSTLDKWPVCTAATIGRHGPILLAKIDLDHVAVAGGKIGIAPGSTIDPPQRPK